MNIFLSIVLMGISCFIIWKAGNSFDIASEYLGRKMSAGVKGATINAIGSSIPEFFTSILFLLLHRDEQGFAGGIGTSTGSAVFNAIIIPAVVILVVSLKLKNRIVISKKVILRDGISLIIAELVLIYIIGNGTLTRMHSLFLMLLYAVYLIVLFAGMKRNTRISFDKKIMVEHKSRLSTLMKLDLRAFFIRDKPLNSVNARVLLLISIFVIGAACFLLVYSCELLGEATNISLYFVSIILTSAATSVPDMVLSIKDAQNGNYNDALSNAFGSNVFDICFAIGFPLFLFSLIYNRPIQLSSQTIQDIMPLQILLILFTLITIIIFLIGHSLGRVTAYVLLSMYGIFISFIIFQSLHLYPIKPLIEALNQIEVFIQNIL